MDVIILDMGPDVKGESERRDYAGKIELLSFSHGVAMQITGDVGGSERTSGKPNHQDMTVTKYIDSASPLLFQRCLEAHEFPRADIVVGRDDRGGGVSELMRYTLKGVIISSVSVGGGGGDKPVESVTLNYKQITWSYKKQRPDGGEEVEGRWDLSTNSAG